VQATGVRLGMILQALSTIAIGLVIAFIYSWKFALFVFGVMPFILCGAVMQIRLAKGFSMKNMAKLMEAGKVRSKQRELILLKTNSSMRLVLDGYYFILRSWQ
jgi:ABC-type multidrug transport system fused ATPase/permease subunit